MILEPSVSRKWFVIEFIVFTLSFHCWVGSALFLFCHPLAFSPSSVFSPCDLGSHIALPYCERWLYLMTYPLELSLSINKNALDFLFINSHSIVRENVIKTVCLFLKTRSWTLGKRCIYRFVTLGHISLRVSSTESKAVGGVGVGVNRTHIIIIFNPISK